VAARLNRPGVRPWRAGQAAGATRGAVRLGGCGAGESRSETS
jgi:hypothetical protein